MSELFEKSIRVLELPRLLEMLEHHAVSAEAKARARRLTPSDDFGEVNRLLDETDAARKMIMLRGSPAFGGVRDVGEALSRAERGGMLNTRELLDIAGLLTNVRRVQDYYKEDEEGTVIDKLFLSLHPNRFLEEKITTAILDENEIADAASPELAEIRRHKRAAAAKGRQILQRIISSPSYRNVLQDALLRRLVETGSLSILDFLYIVDVCDLPVLRGHDGTALYRDIVKRCGLRQMLFKYQTEFFLAICPLYLCTNPLTQRLVRNLANQIV